MSDAVVTVPGQCLVCGPRGAYPSGRGLTLCPRCEGSGRDPRRGSDWYWDLVLPVQRDVAAELDRVDPL